MRVLTAKETRQLYMNIMNIIREIASLENPRVLWFRQPVVHNHLRKKVTLSFIIQVTIERFCRRPFRHIDEYATARVQGSSSLAIELHVTMRPNGRAIDAFQQRVGGVLFEVEAKLDDFIPLARFKNWVVRFQQRPANILIRLNMTTSIWQCLAPLVMMREGAGIAAGEFVRILIEQEEDDEPDAASFRWVVVIDDAMPISFKITIFNHSYQLNTYCVCAVE